ncbi:MAG: radical SAM protein [Clostridiales bacterium]|nr:radical SAM protein [Clostridiales bacterium]
MHKKIIIPIFIPHKGCPFDCIYCNQKSISGQIKDVTIDDVKSTIRAFKDTISFDEIPEVAFYGGSFTGIDMEEQTKFLECVYDYIKKGEVSSIRLSTRPDYISHEILKNLKKYGVKTIELGVQSLDDEVLRISHRGHTREDVESAVRLVKEYGFNLGIQTMIGLPNDTKKKAIDTARKVVLLKPDFVRIYPTLVIKDTYLCKMLEEHKYKPLSLEDAVDISASLYRIYMDNNIEVIRLGLQPTKNIEEGEDVRGGPFHPAFRQLVEARILRDIIEIQIKEKDLSDSVDIYVGNCYVSSAVGQKKENIQYLKNKFGFKRVKIHGVEGQKFGLVLVG